jgi:hypothetical protein
MTTGGIEMKVRILHIIAITMLVLSTLGGCGDTSGVNVTANIVPTYNGINTSDVDAVRDMCPSGTLEYFADHMATATITANILNPAINPSETVHIDGYTIDYVSLADSPNAPPIQRYVGNESLSFTVSGNGTAQVTGTVEFVDLIRKVQYIQDLTSGSYQSSAAYLNNYEATYTFEGHTDSGSNFTFSASASFEIGDFNNCQ